MPVRARRDILIQAQHILQQIEKCEDQLDLFQSLDLPAYQAWLQSHFPQETQALAEVEHLYAEALRHHGAVIALAKMRKVSMVRAFDLFKTEQLSYANGTPAQRQRIENNRRQRERRTENTPTEALPSPPAGSESLKSLYRKLARRLHPDLQMHETDAEEQRWQRRQWELLVQAHRRGDALAMERLYHMTLIRQMDFSELTLEDATDAHASLTREHDRLEKDLAQARQTPGWGFTKVQDLNALAGHTRDSLQAKIERRRQDLKELEGQLAYLEVMSATRRRRRQPSPRKAQLSLFD